MAHGAALLFDLIAKDGASPAFLKVAGAADKAAASTLRAQKGIAGLPAVASRTGARLTKSLTLPLVGLAAVATSQAVKYEKSLNTIRVATDQSTKSMALAHKSLLAISVKTGTSTDQLSESLYTAAKSGAPMAKALGIVTAAAQGAKAEGADLGTVTNALTSIMASYGSKLRNPITAMNMIVRGSGAAKTTIQDFAGSLSNVVPVAASLGVGFDQVAAAIATMTQHGETAQHATDNLRNLMTNLAGQNAVAAGTMSQLGVSTLKVSGLLSKKGPGGGLVGALDYVLGRVGKLSDGGRIVVDTFKKSSLATFSLNKMLGTMSGSLKKNSEGLLKGSTNIKDYTAYAKSMGGQAGAGALQFLALYKGAKGFSNMIRTGKGNVLTYATALQKMFGGIPGMNTALQLSGESARQFHHLATEFAGVAKTSGKAVIGFAQTQKTAAFKADQAKASLHKLAIQAGDVLLPAFKSLADAGTKAFKWVDGLNSGQKKVLGWSVGILAAVGPVLALSGKLMLLGGGIARAAGVIGLGFAKIAGASATTSLAVQRNMSRMGAALGGAGLGFAIGSMTKNASGAAQAVGALASTATGAIIGFGAGGAVGAAIGAGAGLLSNLATNFLGADDAAKNAASSVQTFTDAILKDNLALGVNTRAVVANDFLKTHLFDKANKLNIGARQLTSAGLGNTTARSSITAVLDQNTNQKLGISREGVAAAHITDRARQVLGIGADVTKLTDSQVGKLKELAGASNDVRKALGLESDTVRRAKHDAEQYTKATSAAGKNDSARSKALKSITTAQTAAGNSLRRLTAQVGVHGTSLRGAKADGSVNADGASNIAALSGLMKKYKDVENAQVLAGTSTKRAAAGFDASTAAVRRQAVALGFNAQSVNTLIGKYRQTPKQIVTTMLAHIGRATASTGQLQRVIDSIEQHKIPGLTADSAQGRAIIDAMQARINRLTGKTVSLTVIPDFSRLPSGYKLPGGAKTGGGPNGDGKARGGLIRGPGTGTSDTAGVFALSNGEAVIPAKAVSRHRGVVDSLIAVGRGLAGGGIVHQGKDWIVNGTRYASERAAKNAASRGKKTDQSALSSSVSSGISGIGQAGSSPFQLADVGVARMAATLRSATAKLLAAIDKGLSSKAAGRFRHQIADLARLANKQLGALRLKIRTTDIRSLRHALKGTVDDTRASMQQLLGDLAKSGASRRVRGLISGAGSRLVGEQAQLGRERNRLSSMRGYRGGIRDTLKGAFDPTQAGSVTDLLSGLGGATANNKKYTSQVSGLLNRAKGNKTLTGFINQLAASGNTATLDSLAGASKSELAQVSKGVGSYSASLTAGADAATTGKYGESVAHQRQDVVDLRKDMRDTLGVVSQMMAMLPGLHFNLDGHVIEAKMDHKDAALLRKLEHALAKGSHN